MPNKIDFEIVKTIKQKRTSGGSRTIYITKCKECLSLIKIRRSEIKKASFKCQSCSHKKNPFESLFNTFCLDHRKLSNTITFKNFLNFTKQKNCHYCLDKINWIEYSTVNGKFKSNAYYLDRKNNTKGYSVKNCVVCCTKCNLAKGNRYSYEEWYGMTKYFRSKK